MTNKTFIFDLDHTVIDSSHRQITLADGSLDLDNWIANCTQEKIMADKLLPLAQHWRTFQAAGNEIVVCTARVMGKWDNVFLADHGLTADAILSRPLGCTDADADLKETLLRDYAQKTGRSWARFSRNAAMYDDNMGVLLRLESIGIACYNALSLNAILKAA
tara:strand:+ start:1011 stop:1496 length:486 start_codon:yes stop_codon:yes gene_type:complete